MIKIINSSNETQAILENVTTPIISEEINRNFTFGFSTLINNDKSSYVNYQNKVSVNDNYFNIVYTEESRTENGLFIRAECEHVSYDLLSANFTAGFTATGLFSAVATTLLSGTGFSIGTNEITASETISVNQSTNARQLLLQLASLYGGELEFDKYTINLLTRRGADRGVQFRYRKNLVGVSRIVDNRNKTAGLPTISYGTKIALLEYEQSYISSGKSANEHVELGDTVKSIDEDLGIDTSLRIVKMSYDPEFPDVGDVEIGNFIDDLSDTLTQIQTTSVAKDAVYNGCSIGPNDGFVATRSDELVKTSMNATNGLAIDMRDTATASYTSVFYVQTDTATGTVNLYLVGNAVFTGTVEASTINGSDIIGGTITIGTGSNTFNANGTDGMWLGYSAFATAPCRISLSGSGTMSDLTLTGGLFNIGTGTNTMQFNTIDGLFLGNTAASSAPFKVSMSGSVTATDITMTGSSTITGGTITGGIIRTSASGQRIELSGNTLSTYNSSNQLNGMVMEGDTSSSFTYGDLYFYDSGTKVLEIYNNLIGAGYSIRPAGSAALNLGRAGYTTYLNGTIDFGSATIANLGATGTIYTTASQTITVTNGIITNIV